MENILKNLTKENTLLVSGGNNDACANEVKHDMKKAEHEVKDFVTDTMDNVGDGANKVAKKINKVIDNNHSH